MTNINILFNARISALKFIEDYSSIILKAKRLEKQGTGLKTLTPKQMLQRLLIALAQIKADNNSESLLNESGRLLTLCINQKKLPKKVYNNIIKSIKV